MATTFGTSPKSTSITSDEVLKAYRHFAKTSPNIIDPDIRVNAETFLVDSTIQWFNTHPLTLKNMSVWSKILGEYIPYTIDRMDVRLAQPIAKYLNFVSIISADNLFGTDGRRSVRYDGFCEVVNHLATKHLILPNDALYHIAHDSLVDLHTLMTHLNSMREAQYNYEVYVLDNSGEYKEFPEGILMRSLLSLSYATTIWTAPPGNVMYHDMWEVIETYDYEDTSPGVEDILTHLVNTLPGSTKEALEYYSFHSDDMLPEQQQVMLSMSMSHLKFPDDLPVLIESVYHNEYDDGHGIQLLNAMNPATQVLHTYMALYADTEELVEHLATQPKVKDMFLWSDCMRRKEDGDALVAHWNKELTGPQP